MEKKIKDYDVVSSYNGLQLGIIVQEKMKEGWVVYGFPFLGPNNQVCQGIVKYE